MVAFWPDSFLRSRSSTDHEATAMIKTQFMSFWDGLMTDPDCRVMVMGATNRPQDVDAAILRRMPSMFQIGFPVRGGMWEVDSLLCMWKTVWSSLVCVEQCVKSVLCCVWGGMCEVILLLCAWRNVWSRFFVIYWTASAFSTRLLPYKFF